MEERRKRRHQDDAEGGYDDEKGKRRRTLSSNSQRSDKLDGHSTGETLFSCIYRVILLPTISLQIY